MATRARRRLHRRSTHHDDDPATPAQIARQQILARALPALAHYHLGKSWGGAYISTPSPSEHSWHSVRLDDEQRLLAILDELDDEEDME